MAKKEEMPAISLAMQPTSAGQLIIRERRINRLINAIFFRCQLTGIQTLLCAALLFVLSRNMNLATHSLKPIRMLPDTMCFNGSAAPFTYFSSLSSTNLSSDDCVFKRSSERQHMFDLFSKKLSGSNALQGASRHIHFQNVGGC